MPLCWTGPFSREVRVYRYSSSSRMEKVTGRLASRYTLLPTSICLFFFFYHHHHKAEPVCLSASKCRPNRPLSFFCRTILASIDSAKSGLNSGLSCPSFRSKKESEITQDPQVTAQTSSRSRHFCRCCR